MAKRLIHQECHSVILWDKPFQSATTKTRIQPFSHEIPPAPEKKPRWNYPVDPPKIRSKQYVLIEEHGKRHQEDNQENVQKSQNLSSSLPSSRESSRPQSAQIRNNSSTNFNANINTSRNDEKLKSSRPVSAPKFRQPSQQSHDSQIDATPTSGIAICNSSRGNNSNTTPSTTTMTTTTTTVQESSRRRNRPFSSTLPRPSSPNSRSFPSPSPSHPSPSYSATPSAVSSRPSSAHQFSSFSSSSRQSLPDSSSKHSFVANPLFKSKKKTYFDFKRIPSNDELFQPTTHIISGGYLPGSIPPPSLPSSSSDSGPEYATSPSPKRAPVSRVHKNPRPHSTKHTSGPVSVSVNQVKVPVIGRSQETARIHHLIDDMMMRLSTMDSKRERIEIKQEFTQLVSQFAQQSSKGGDY